MGDLTHWLIKLERRSLGQRSLPLPSRFLRRQPDRQGSAKLIWCAVLYPAHSRSTSGNHLTQREDAAGEVLWPAAIGRRAGRCRRPRRGQGCANLYYITDNSITANKFARAQTPKMTLYTTASRSENGPRSQLSNFRNLRVSMEIQSKTANQEPGKTGLKSGHLRNAYRRIHSSKNRPMSKELTRK